MNVLKALGIILVVAGHAGGLILPWFHPYSFHMPLFIFISGYFYKTVSEYSIRNFTRKRFISLVIPYFKWNLIYGVLVYLTNSINLTQFGRGEPLSIHSLLIEPWISGHQYYFNIAAWFVLTLFLVQILYIITRKAFSYFIKNEFVLMFIYLLIGILGTYLATFHEMNELNSYYYLLRVLVGLPFFHLGYLYKHKLEKIDRFNSITFICLIIYQALLIYYYKNITFQMVWGNFGDNLLLPFLSSISGIWLFIHIAEMVDNKIKNDRLLNYIGQNTWDIMLHHLFAFWIVNVGFFTLNRIGILEKMGLPMLDVNLFKTDIYYKYNQPFTYLIYVLLGIFLPLGYKLLVDKFSYKRNKRKTISIPSQAD